MLYEAWLVDLDGTLYHSLPVRALMGAELVFGGPRAVRTISEFRRQHEDLRANPDPGSDPYRAQLARAARALDRNVDDVANDVTAWMHVRPGRYIHLFRRRSLLDEIAQHRVRGGKTALVSDYPATKKLGALGATALFDVIVASGEPGGPSRLKPDPEGYLLAAKALDVAPERCLVIGDRDDADGAAARAAGMAWRRVG